MSARLRIDTVRGWHRVDRSHVRLVSLISEQPGQMQLTIPARWEISRHDARDKLSLIVEQPDRWGTHSRALSEQWCESIEHGRLLAAEALLDHEWCSAIDARMIEVFIGRNTLGYATSIGGRAYSLAYDRLVDRRLQRAERRAS